MVAAGGTLTLSGASAKGIDQGYTVEDAGAATFAGGNLVITKGARLLIDAGGTFTAADDAAITNNDFASGTVENHGTFTKQGGTGATVHHGEVLDNTGTVDVETGTLTAQVAQYDIHQALTAGTWVVADGATLPFPGQNLATNAATVRLLGPGASLPQLATLSSNTGTLDLLGGKSFTTAGDYSNSGAITLGPASRLNVQGAYTQAATGRLTSQVGGTAASGQFGQFAATGAARLDGTLAVALTGGFVPARNDAYTVATYASQAGNPRFSAPVAGHQPLFGLTLNAGSAVVTVTTEPSDLSVASVATPDPATPGASVTVHYTALRSAPATSGTAWSISAGITTPRP
jgi:hypothetical protein